MEFIFLTKNFVLISIFFEKELRR